MLGDRVVGPNFSSHGRLRIQPTLKAETRSGNGRVSCPEGQGDSRRVYLPCFSKLPIGTAEAQDADSSLIPLSDGQTRSGNIGLSEGRVAIEAESR